MHTLLKTEYLRYGHRISTSGICVHSLPQRKRRGLEGNGREKDKRRKTREALEAGITSPVTRTYHDWQLYRVRWGSIKACTCYVMYVYHGIGARYQVYIRSYNFANFLLARSMLPSLNYLIRRKRTAIWCNCLL